MHKKGPLCWVVLVLLLVGGLNWGLVGLGGFLGGNWNVVNLLAGSLPWLENGVYLLVGLAALYKLVKLVVKCHSSSESAEGGCCGSGTCGPKMPQ